MKNFKRILGCTCTAALIGTMSLSSFAASSNVTKIFSDVADGAWYTEYVQYVYDNALMTGMKGTDLFQPDTRITKAQVAQVLYNKENQPKVTDKTVFSKLKDVSEKDWYADAVAWAYGNGIVTGDTYHMTFSPNADVTREQLALMMYRYSDYKDYDISKRGNLNGMANTNKVSEWAETAVKWAVGVELISGLKTSSGYDLAPQGNATRAQMATILERYCTDYLNTSKKDDNSDGLWTPYL